MTTAVQSQARGRVNRRIFGATATVAAATVLVKLVSVFKEFVVAGAFGRSDELEAFLLAALLPGLLINLVSESMNQALVPVLVRARERDGKEGARRLLSNCLIGSSALLVGFSAAVGMSARWLLPLAALHFGPGKMDLAVLLLRGVLPVIIFAGLASTMSSVLNTEGDFAVPAAAPVVNSVFLIAGVALFARSGGTWVLVYAWVAGSFVHAALMAKRMRARGYWFGLHWGGLDADTREVARQFGPLALSGLVASGGLLVDQGMAASLQAGSLSALVYAGRFVAVPMALFGGAVSTALAPVFSEMIARDERAGCRKLLRTWAWRTFGLASAITAGLIVASRTLVRATLQHGVFGPVDTKAVSAVLVMYALQIPFFVSSRVFYRFLVAAGRTDLVLYCGILNLALDVVLNLVLMRWMGVAGIALATSLWTLSTFIFLWYWSGRLLRTANLSVASARAVD